jgi:TRAP transporter TAXI family solute receptor
MRDFSRRAVLSASGAFAAAAVGLYPRVAAAQSPRFFRIATGPTESAYFAIGSLIGNVVSSPPGARECNRGGNCGVPGLIAVTQTTAGSLANVELIGRRQVESGLCQADIAHWAFQGAGPYRRQGPVNTLRTIANLYPEVMHLVVRRDSPIKDLRRLRGRVVSLGEQDSGTLATARAILQAAGIAEREFKPLFLKPAQAANALRDAVIDAFFEMARSPSTTIAELAEKTPIDLVSIDDAVRTRLRGSNPYFGDDMIPADTYHQVGDVRSVSVGVLWICGAEVDDKIVYGLTRALFHPNNRKTLDSGHPFGARIRPETAAEGAALQLHPGAALYYVEAGLIR